MLRRHSYSKGVPRALGPVIQCLDSLDETVKAAALVGVSRLVEGGDESAMAAVVKHHTLETTEETVEEDT